MTWAHLLQKAELALSSERLELGPVEGMQQCGCGWNSTPWTWLACVYSCAWLVFYFSRMRSKGPVSLWGSGGWGCARSTSPNRSQPFATVRKPSATVIFATVRNCSREGRMAVPMVVAAFRVAGVALRDIQTCFLTCGKSFVWQAQYFCDVLVALFWKKMKALFLG